MELEQNRQTLEKQGVKLVAISYDTPEILRNFAARRGIGYPLLSDPESKVIRLFGVLNTSLAENSRSIGVPYPGLVLVDQNGVVEGRYFEDDYSERYTLGSILASRFRVDIASAATRKKSQHATIETSASAESVRGGQRIALMLDIGIEPGMHVYAPGVGADYIPVSWNVEASEAWRLMQPSYPEGTVMRSLGEDVPVYENRLRVTREVALGNEAALRKLTDSSGAFVIPGSFRYQACSTRECFPPVNVSLEWRLKLESHDRERAPAELRKLK